VNAQERPQVDSERLAAADAAMAADEAREAEAHAWIEGVIGDAGALCPGGSPATRPVT
jgi:hypothetical protein